MFEVKLDITNETLQRAFKEGVYMNLRGNAAPAEADLEEMPDLDLEKEAERHRHCKWWSEADKEKFDNRPSGDVGEWDASRGAVNRLRPL